MILWNNVFFRKKHIGYFFENIEFVLWFKNNIILLLLS